MEGSELNLAAIEIVVEFGSKPLLKLDDFYNAQKI